MIVIVSEKPHLSRIFHNALVQKWPNEELFFVHTYGIPVVKFKYPKNLKLNDYPRVAEPVYKITDSYFEPQIVSRSYHVKNGRFSIVEHKEDDLCELFKNNPKIVFMCDPDVRGVFSFDIFLRTFAEHLHDKEHEAIYIFGTDIQSVNRAVTETLTTHSQPHKELLSKALVKRYFEYNFNTNALVILRKPFEEIFGKEHEVQMSKYELQVLLYLVKRGESVGQHELFKLMNNWPGTGKYNASDFPGCKIGSATSQTKIITNLCDIGALNFSKDVLNVTEAGSAFVQLIHKGMHDPDLPYRLAIWESEGLGIAQFKIDAYIKRSFGRQKNKNKLPTISPKAVN